MSVEIISTLSPVSQYTPLSHRFIDHDMMMRYHLGLGVGHVYGYKCMGTPTGTSQHDSEGAAMAVNVGICIDPHVLDVREGDQVAAHESDLEESGPKDLDSSWSSKSSSVSDLNVHSNSDESVTSDVGSVNFEAVMYYDSAEGSEGLDDSEDMYEF